MKILIFIIFICYIINFWNIEAKKYDNFDKTLRSPGSMVPKTFLSRKTSSIGELRCSCPNVNLCKCCQMITLMYSLSQKNLCANFMYTQNGLNVNMSLNSFVVKATTISTFKPTKLCNKVPGSLFSSVCISILELNAFPRSLTVCPRLDISSRTQEWKLTYSCISISTQLSSPIKIPNGIMTGGILVTPNQGHLLILPVGGQQIGTSMSTIKPGGQMGVTTTTQKSLVMPMSTGGMSPPSPSQGATSPKTPVTSIKPTMQMTTVAVSSMPVMPGDISKPKPLTYQSSQSRESDENYETIILHSPDSNDRSKFFPSRLPPAFNNLSEIGYVTLNK